MIWDFHFLRPWWLLGVVFAVGLLLVATRQNDIRARWKGMIAPHLLDHLLISGSEASRFQPYHLAVVLAIIGSIAVAGPTWEREKPPFVADTAPLVIAVDLSPTMDAIDITPSRLGRAKLKIHDIIALRKGARTALVAYSGSAHLVLPLTEDASLVATYADALETRIMPVAGRSIGTAVDFADNLLSAEEASGTILLMTDAVDSGAITALNRGDRPNGVIVLGIGTPEGGPVKAPDGSFVSDSSGARLFPKLDVDAFNRLKSQTDADVATVSTDDRDVKWIAERIQTHFEQQIADGNARWKDMGWWLMILLVPLTAFFFRRGWVIRWTGILLAAHVILQPDPAAAADRAFIDAFLTQDQQGRRAFEQGDFEAAATHFQDPMWLGAAHYRAGKYADAVDAFARVQSPESDYNQGNALVYLKKYGDAIAAYKRALDKRKDWKEAEANLAIAETLAKKEKDKEDEDTQDPNDKPDQIQFDKDDKKGKLGKVDMAAQTSEMWMKNIVVSPTDLLARKFALESGSAKK